MKQAGAEVGLSLHKKYFLSFFIKNQQRLVIISKDHS